MPSQFHIICKTIKDYQSEKLSICFDFTESFGGKGWIEMALSYMTTILISLTLITQRAADSQHITDPNDMKLQKDEQASFSLMTDFTHPPRGRKGEDSHFLFLNID